MTKFLALAVAGFVAVSVSQASAASMTVTGNFGPTATDFSGLAFSVPGFNTTLGTLTNVSVTLGSSSTISGPVKNNSTSAQTFTLNTDAKVTINSATSSIDGLFLDLTASQSYTALAAGSSSTYGPFNPSQSSTNSSALPLSAFTSGPINLTATTVTNESFAGGGGNISAPLTATASGTVTLVYTYTPPPPASVPEPASMALLGMGLAGLGLIRRRRA